MSRATASSPVSERSNRAEKPLPLALRELRHKSGLSLTEAADFVGMHKARLSEIERGVRGPSAAELQLLAWYYGPLEVAFVVREVRA